MRRPVIFSLSILACLLAATSAAAQVRAKPSDLLATHRYLEAKIVLEKASGKLFPAQLQAISNLAAKIQGECPAVLAGEPPAAKDESFNQARVDMSEETFFVSFTAAENVERSAQARFERTVRKLRWSNGKLTTFLRSLALEGAEQAEIQLPDVCTDAKFWAASSYTAVSPGTERYVKRQDEVSEITKIEQEPHEPPMHSTDAIVRYRLRPYENRADRSLVKKVFPQERSSEAVDHSLQLKRLFEAIGEVTAALGRPQA